MLPKHLKEKTYYKEERIGEINKQGKEEGQRKKEGR
jgi:hypothetical protein